MKPVIYVGNLLASAVWPNNAAKNGRAFDKESDGDDNSTRRLNDGFIERSQWPVQSGATLGVSGVQNLLWISGASGVALGATHMVVMKGANLSGMTLRLTASSGDAFASYTVSGWDQISGAGGATLNQADHLMTSDGPELIALNVSGVSRQTWRLHAGVGSGSTVGTNDGKLLLPIGEEKQNGVLRAAYGPGLTASGTWTPNGGGSVEFALGAANAAKVLSSGLWATTVKLDTQAPHALNALTYSGTFQDSGFQPSQWARLRINLGLAVPGNVAGVRVTLSGLDADGDPGSIYWTVPVADIATVTAAGHPLSTHVLEVASGTAGGAADFVADRLITSGDTVTGGYWLYVDWLRGDKVDPLPGHPFIGELVLCSALQFPRRPIVGVERTRVWQRSRQPIPGQPPITFRAGDSVRVRSYTLVATRAELAPLRSWMQNEGNTGAPFPFQDDEGAIWWAVLDQADFVEEDEAGVETLVLRFREVKSE